MTKTRRARFVVSREGETLTIKSLPRPDVWTLIWIPLSVGFLTLIPALPIWIKLIFWAVLAVLWFRSAFGTDYLLVAEDGLTVRRTVGFLHRTSSYEAKSVESLGYQPQIQGYRTNMASGLTVMASSRMTPLLFARGVTEEEAFQLLEQLKGIAWVRSKIRDVSKQSGVNQRE